MMVAMSEPKTRTGYMDKVDFDEELGNASGGNRVYPSVENLQRQQPCSKECGIVKVEVKLLEVVVPEMPIKERPGFKEAMERAKAKHDSKLPHIPYLYVGEMWARLPCGAYPKGQIFTIETIQDELVYWTDGTQTNARSLTDGTWGRVSVPRPRQQRPDASAPPEPSNAPQDG